MDKRVYDLDVPFSSVTSKLIARLLDAGYHCIALSQTISLDDFNFNVDTVSNSTDENNKKKKKSKEERQSMRSALLEQLKPPSVESLNKLLSDSHQFRATIWPSSVFYHPRLFRRVNIHCTDVQLAGLFFREFGESLNQFDIVSIWPHSADGLNYAFENPTLLDVISIDLSRISSELYLTSKQCSSMLQRGLSLEFQYSPLLHPGSSGTTARSNLAFYLTSLLGSVRPAFSKAITISSGATCGWNVRRPMAVMCILQSLGLKPQHVTQSALTTGPYNVLTHGLWRSRTAHGAVSLLRLLANPSVTSIEPLNELKNDDSLASEKPPEKRQCMDTS